MNETTETKTESAAATPEPEKTRWWAVFLALGVTAVICFFGIQYYQYAKPQNDFEQGLSGIRNGDWALVRLQITALRGNRRFEAHHDYLESALKINGGELNEAELLLEKPLEHEDLKSLALVAEGIIALQRRDLDLAKSKVADALEIDPDLPEAIRLSENLDGVELPMTRVSRAVRAIDAGDLATVQSELKALKEVEGGDPYVKFIGGVVLMRDNKYEAALNAFGAAKDNPELAAQTLTLSGEALYHLNQRGPAANLFLQSLLIDDEQVNAHRWLASLYYDNGANDHAAAHLRRIAQLAPDDFRPYRLLASMSKDFRDYEGAVENYNEALDRDAPVLVRAEMLLEKAQSLTRLRRYAEARETLDSPLLSEIKEPRFVAMMKNTQAECLLDSGNANDADVLVNEVLTADARNLDGLILKGSIQQLNGEIDQAATTFEAAVQVDPYNYTAHFKLAQAYAAQNKSDLAKQTQARAEELKTQLEQFSKLHEAAAADMQDAETRFKLGQMALTLGRPQIAKTWFAAAIGLDPNHAAARAELEKLVGPLPDAPGLAPAEGGDGQGGAAIGPGTNTPSGG